MSISKSDRIGNRSSTAKHPDVSLEATKGSEIRMELNEI